MSKQQTPNEFELIARYFAPLSRDEPGAFGLADDAAVLAMTPGHLLVVTTDSLVEGVHFRPQDPPGAVAAKLLRVNMSDLAAMGAKPVAYTLSAALPEDIDGDWIGRFAKTLAEDQTRFGVTLVGGDTVATPGPLALTLTAFGSVEEGRQLLRSAAQPGDAVYVSGTIGDAALGLRALRGDLPGLPPESASALTERYQRPRPRVDLGMRLYGLIHAAIDVSDGLMADLGHICRASRVDATVEAAGVPLSAAARSAIDQNGELMAIVLTGGDDYELLFTAPTDAAAELTALSAALDLPLTRIGRITEGKGKVRALAADGGELTFDELGFRHF